MTLRTVCISITPSLPAVLWGRRFTLLVQTIYSPSPREGTLLASVTLAIVRVCTCHNWWPQVWSLAADTFFRTRSLSESTAQHAKENSAARAGQTQTSTLKQKYTVPNSEPLSKGQVVEISQSSEMRAFGKGVDRQRAPTLSQSSRTALTMPASALPKWAVWLASPCSGPGYWVRSLLRTDWIPPGLTG